MWLWRVLRCISHGAARVLNIDTHMDMDTWAWTDMDMDMDIDMGMDWVLHLDTCNDREGNVMAMLIPKGLGFYGLGFRTMC